MKELVEFANDQPQNNLDRVIWWLEYVIRHNGTINLKASDVDVPFYSYYNIDIIVALLIMLSVGSTIKMYLFVSTRNTFVKIKTKS